MPDMPSPGLRGAVHISIHNNSLIYLNLGKCGSVYAGKIVPFENILRKSK